jgi:hypothetical protein
VGLLQIVSPLRYGRRYGAGTACLVFLVAVADVQAALYADATAQRLPVDVLAPEYQAGALPIATIVALATTLAFGLLMRQRAIRTRS